MSAWQPIATAPADGTRVLVWDGLDVWIASRRISADDPVGIWWPDDGEASPVDAIYWQPLPEPPP